MSSLVYPTLPGLAFEVIRTPRWNNIIQEAVNGVATTIGRQLYPLLHFELVYSVLRDSVSFPEVKALVGLFNALQGGYDTFLFTDPDFNTITVANPSQFGIGDGSTTGFQLLAYYGNTSGIQGYQEMVQALNGSPVIYDNGSTVNPVNYSITNGFVTFTSAPLNTHVLSWSGQFYYRCAFDEDSLDVLKFMSQAGAGLWEAKKVQFTQVHV